MCDLYIRYKCLSGLSPFLDDSVEETTANILKCDFCFPDEYFDMISSDAKELLRRLLCLRGEDRANAEICFASSWLKVANPEISNFFFEYILYYLLLIFFRNIYITHFQSYCFHLTSTINATKFLVIITRATFCVAFFFQISTGAIIPSSRMAAFIERRAHCLKLRQDHDSFYS